MVESRGMWLSGCWVYGCLDLVGLRNVVEAFEIWSLLRIKGLVVGGHGLWSLRVMGSMVDAGLVGE